MINISPLDAYNQQLLDRVHPQSWINPQPAAIYDLVVIGAGTAGLVVAAGAAGLDLGLRVALVERNLMGGDCLNFGCVPSKTIIRSSRIVGELLRGQELGVNTGSAEVDFAAVMERLRRIRSQISSHDSADRFKNLGVDVFFGDGQFTDQDTITVESQQLKFKKAVIATGARAAIPAITGLAAAGYLTNETIFNLEARPRRLGIIGGGPIGCELAQAFQRLGCEVVLFHNHSHVLTNQDPDAAAILQQVLLAEGVRLMLNCQVQQVTIDQSGKVITYQRAEHLATNQPETITVDQILVGAGRTPNIDTLNLPTIGVDFNDQGVKVNDYLQTTNPRIYAAGDVCLKWQFTHAADAAARIVIKNTLFAPFGLGRSKLSSLVIPGVTYTDPEIAQVGLSEQRAIAQQIPIETIKISMANVDRAITDGQTNGFVKIIHARGSDKILGATIVASHAGELISEITTAMVNQIGLSKLSSVIHPYPTQSAGIKQAADAYRRTLLTPANKRILGWLTKFA